MNDDFSDLEAELKRMRPCAPSSELQARLAATLDRPAAPTAQPVRIDRSANSRRAWKWVLWPAAVAAAVVLALVTMRQPDSVKTTAGQTAHPIGGNEAGPLAASTAAADLYEPVSAENVLYDSRDYGLVMLDDGTAAHRVFQRYLDTYTWRNPRTNASLRWTVPRDEVRVIPVRAY
jgi:anti-sigma-K factor RskA